MITIDPKAQEYIRKNGSAVHLIDNGQASLCCGRIELCPSVRLGIPKNTKDYTIKPADGIELFLPKKFYYPHPLTIELKKFLWRDSLTITGWKLI